MRGTQRRKHLARAEAVRSARGDPPRPDCDVPIEPTVGSACPIGRNWPIADIRSRTNRDSTPLPPAPAANSRRSTASDPRAAPAPPQLSTAACGFASNGPVTVRPNARPAHRRHPDPADQHWYAPENNAHPDRISRCSRAPLGYRRRPNRPRAASGMVHHQNLCPPTDRRATTAGCCQRRTAPESPRRPRSRQTKPPNPTTPPTSADKPASSTPITSASVVTIGPPPLRRRTNNFRQSATESGELVTVAGRPDPPRRSPRSAPPGSQSHAAHRGPLLPAYPCDRGDTPTPTSTTPPHAIRRSTYPPRRAPRTATRR